MERSHVEPVEAEQKPVTKAEPKAEPVEEVKSERKEKP